MAKFMETLGPFTPRGWRRLLALFALNILFVVSIYRNYHFNVHEVTIIGSVYLGYFGFDGLGKYGQAKHAAAAKEKKDEP